MDPTLIRIETLRRTYRNGQVELAALAGIDLTLAGGEFVGITGPSGSGKSTLLNLLGGLDSPTDGRIVVAGQDIATMGQKQLARYRRRSVGMVFQSFQLVGSYTAVENVAMPLLFAGVGRRDRLRAAQARLSQVGLSDRARHKPSEMSGGEQQRVAIARALVGDPHILLADEPTGNLDTASGQNVMKLLAKANAELGVTIVMVSHELPLLEQYASRVVGLRDGQLETDRLLEASP